MLRRLVMAFPIALVSAIIGCKSTSDPDDESCIEGPEMLRSITVSPKTLTLTVGQVENVNARADDSGRLFCIGYPAWSSTNSSIAIVTEGILGRAYVGGLSPGTTYIHATLGSMGDSLKVTVTSK